MNNNCLLSTAYLPNIQYLSKIVSYSNVYIEQYETYSRQSYRNRTHIYSANGIQALQIPIAKISGKNTPLKDIKISYDTNWQKNHLKSIESAYRSTPFYEYYIDDIICFYKEKSKYLLDYNIKILETILSILDIDKNIKLSEDFVLKPENTDDFRNSIHPKPKYNSEDNSFRPIQYIQGFEQRHGFVPNLSVLDLIFNTGTEAESIIIQSAKID
jgi:hypothetical protein